METLSYQQWLDAFKREWEPGQHVLLVGPTGSGKTVAAEDMLLLRKYVVIIATKAKDKSLDAYKEAGFKTLEEWPPPWNIKRVLFWRKPKALGDFATMQVGIYKLLNDVYQHGGWTVSFDDLVFVTGTLKLKEPIRMFYTQVRSMDVSIVSLLQRPFWAPLEAISQSTYALIFSANDEHDVHRLSEGLSVGYKQLLEAIRSLGPFEFIFVRMGKAPIKVSKKEI